MKRDICDAAFPGERARLSHGVLAEIDADRFPGCHGAGEIDGNRARTTPAINEAHPPSQMWREKCGRLAGASGEHSAAPFVVYSVRPLGTRSHVRHAPLPALPAAHVMAARNAAAVRASRSQRDNPVAS
jgi:hypothetical protein